MKYSPAFEHYRVLEDHNERAIAVRFNLDWPWPAPVKTADEAVVLAEAEQLIAMDNDAAKVHTEPGVDPAEIEIVEMTPAEAKAAFLARFRELADERQI